MTTPLHRFLLPWKASLQGFGCLLLLSRRVMLVSEQDASVGRGHLWCSLEEKNIKMQDIVPSWNTAGSCSLFTINTVLGSTRVNGENMRANEITGAFPLYLENC